MDRRSRALRALPALLAAAVGLSGCTAPSSGSQDSGESGSDAVTIAVNADPGSLNPLAASPNSATYTVFGLAYDTLTTTSTPGGETPQPDLAESWKVTATSATFRIRPGVACADGSSVTASVIARNFNWVLDADNGSPWLGAYIKPGSKVSADDAARTLTVTSPEPSSFLLQDLSYLPIVCGKGLDDPGLTDTATSGSGMYQLASSVAGQSYTFHRRQNYTSTSASPATGKGTNPATITLSVVPDDATQSNLLMSGKVDIAQIGGADRERVDRQNYYSVTFPQDPGLVFFNQASGKVTRDGDLRRALAQGLDRSGIGRIATLGRSAGMRTMTSGVPQACTPSRALSSYGPAFDVKAAGAELDRLGWAMGSDGVRHRDGAALSLKVLYPTNRGVGVTSAIEAIQQQWATLGVKVALTGSDSYSGVIFGGGDWDVVWAPLGLEDPSMVPVLLSGTPVPKGRNFASIDNADYNRLVEKAQKTTGTASCPDWDEAERSLVENSDVIPVVGNTRTAYGRGVTFQLKTLGSVVGSSIKVTK